MSFFHQPPIHVTTLLSFLEPSQLRIRFDHGINGLANCFLVDILDVDVQAIDSFND